MSYSASHAEDTEIELDYIIYSIQGDSARVRKASNIFLLKEAKILPSITYKNKAYPVTYIQDYAFYNCTYLTSVTIPESVKIIDDGAFSDCTSLKTITIPSSVTYMGSGMFNSCSNLTTVRIEDVNAWARIRFLSYTSNPMWYGTANLYVGDNTDPIKNLVVEGSEPISDYAFYGATSLERVRVKDGASIGAQSFCNCTNLTDLCLYTSEIKSNAFSGCAGITRVFVPMTTPPSAQNNSFSNYTGVGLYVPVGTASIYETTRPCWWKFSNISECDFTDIDSIFKPDYDNSTSGIESTEKDAYQTTDDIFTIHGTILKHNATENDLKSLNRGIYIFRGKKIIVT